MNRLEDAVAYMRSLAENGFWGVLELKFQHGSVVHIIKHESLQPEQLVPENRRANSDRKLNS